MGLVARSDKVILSGEAGDAHSDRIAVQLRDFLESLRVRHLCSSSAAMVHGCPVSLDTLRQQHCVVLLSRQRTVLDPT